MSWDRFVDVVAHSVVFWAVGLGVAVGSVLGLLVLLELWSWSRRDD